jgi:Holliday junction resolvase
MIPNDPTRYVYSVLRDFYALAEEDVDSVDPKAFVDRLRGVHRGLSAEHEFAAIASWLGKPRLIVSTDDVLFTDNYYRVPDFLVAVRKSDRDLSFVVEVKSNADNKIVWSEKYLSSMRRFAKALGLPFLIAWKRFGIWMLVDAEHIRKKNTAYHLTFECAMKNNLMSALFGNVFLVIKEGFRLEFRLQLLDPADAASELLSEGPHAMKITEAALYTNKGKVPNDLSNELFPLILARSTEPVTEREGGFFRYIFPADHENTFNVSELLIANLTWRLKDKEEVNWLAALRKGLPAPINDLQRVLTRGIEVGALQYVFEQQPELIPEFLRGIDLKIR